MHLDSRFTDRIAAEDEEAMNILNRTLFGLLRCGRLIDAKGLLESLSLVSLSALICIREFLTDPTLSPLDPLDQHFDFAKSRLFLKQTARDIIPIVCCLLILVIKLTV